MVVKTFLYYDCFTTPAVIRKTDQIFCAEPRKKIFQSYIYIQSVNKTHKMKNKKIFFHVKISFLIHRSTKKKHNPFHTKPLTNEWSSTPVRKHRNLSRSPPFFFLISLIYSRGREKARLLYKHS